MGENFTHGDLLGGVQYYVQGQNIEYIDILSVIWIFTIGICTLVPLYLNSLSPKAGRGHVNVHLGWIFKSPMLFLSTGIGILKNDFGFLSTGIRVLPLPYALCYSNTGSISMYVLPYPSQEQYHHKSLTLFW